MHQLWLDALEKNATLKSSVCKYVFLSLIKNVNSEETLAFSFLQKATDRGRVLTARPEKYTKLHNGIQEIVQSCEISQT